tara:strand:+ start:149 stop:433 length:285 start_codon:yes stop_codon:yes gene_type:complete
MQTITFNDSNRSTYIFEDGDTLTATAEHITCPKFIIGDMNSSNATIHTGVTPPGDWAGGKYLFDGTSWTANGDWDDPKEARIAELEAEVDALKA